MSRPRRDQEGPSAVERMEDAFWGALTERPYAEITVGEIAQRAGVNKNTFYYHFDSMRALAEQALDHMLPREIARMFLMRDATSGHPDESQVNALMNDQDLMERTRKGMLVVGKHGSNELISLLKSLVMQTWFDWFEVDESCLSREAMIAVRFTLGGLVELVVDEASWENGTNPAQIVFNSNIVEMASSKVVEMLQEAHEELQMRAEAYSSDVVEKIAENIAAPVC